MGFETITNDNWLSYAMKHYDNPQSVTYDDFLEDMMRFKYLKRLFGRYVKAGVLRNHLILNHLIVIFNVFGNDAGLDILELRVELDHWNVIKPFLIFKRDDFNFADIYGHGYRSKKKWKLAIK